MPPYDRSKDKSSSSGFSDVEDIVVPRRLIASVLAPGGWGKTEWALQATPDPIAVLANDPNTRLVAQKVKRESPDKVIKVQDFKRPFISLSGDEDKMKRAAAREFDRFEESMQDILQEQLDFEPKTVVLDNATVFYDLLNLGEFGRTSQIQWYQRTAPNRRFYDLIAAFESTSMNLILLHQAKDVWEDRETTVMGRGGRNTKIERVKVEGKYERDGFKKVEFLVQVEVALLKDLDRDVSDEAGGIENRFGMRVLKCTQNTSIEGKEYWGLTKQGTRKSSFPFLATRVYPETTLKDWR